MSRNWDWTTIDISSSKDLLPLKGNRIIIRYVCKRCGKPVEAKFRKELYWRQKRFFCRRCNSITTCNEIYGTNNPNQSEVVKAKIRKTSIEKYGVPYPMQNKEISERLKKSLANMSPEKKAEASAKKRQWWKNLSKDELNNILELRKKVWKKNLGVDFPTQSKKVIELQQKNKLERWGDPHYNNMDKNKQTKKERYGNPYYSNSIKAHQTMMSKSTEELKAIHNKIINTRLEKYGTMNIFYKYNYYGIYFDSKPELAVWIYCIDHNIPIIRNPSRFTYMYNNEKHYYEVDFMINGQLVEIKGDQYIDKETGKWIFPYTKHHHNSDKLSVEEKEYYDNLYEVKRQCALSNGVKILYSSECQLYIDYCNSMYPNWDIIYRKDNIYNPSYWCHYINNTYIPNYYNNSNYNKGIGISPYDINNNDEYTICKDSKGISPFDINKEYVV